MFTVSAGPAAICKGVEFVAALKPELHTEDNYACGVCAQHVMGRGRGLAMS